MTSTPPSLFPMPPPAAHARRSGREGFSRRALLGSGMALGLGAVLTVAATGGQASYGGLLMAVYAFGMALPLFVLALLWDRFDLGNMGWLRGREIVIGPLRTHTTSLISGLLFIGIGLLFLLTDGTANLGGVLGVDEQFSMQVWLGEISDKVPDTTLIIGLLLLAALAVAGNAVRRHRAESRAESAADIDT